MAQYNFEGNLDNISERQLEFINKVVLEQDFKVEKVLFEPVGQTGDNFAANVLRIIVKGENNEVRMIAKFAPLDETYRQTANTCLLFNNEHVMYTEVLPTLKQLQKTADVPEEEQLRYAECYGSLREAPNEVIILEDLKESGYTMLNKFESLSDECVRSVIKNIATLHSLSFALKKQDPETFNIFKGKLSDIWSAIDKFEETMKFMQYLENEILLVLKDDHRKNIVKNKLTGMVQQSIKLAKYEENNKHSVIQQGDAWTNNIMFKFEEDKLLGSIMIDYQISKNANPVVDLLYMIFNCTDFESRSKNFYDWIDYYHSELDKSLSNFGLKANFVYPRDQLDADLKTYGKLIFGLSILLASVLMRDSKEAGEFMEAMKNLDANDSMASMNMNNLQNETMVRMKKRIVGLVDSFEQFGLL